MPAARTDHHDHRREHGHAGEFHRHRGGQGRVADDASGRDDLGNLVDRTPDDESLPARAEVE